MVILARAWFSDSVMNFSLTPGLSFSNSVDNFCASVICELDTNAIVTSLSEAPRLPAPAHPDDNNSPVAATHADSLRNILRLVFTFASLLIEPITNVHNRCRTPTTWPTGHATPPGWRHALRLRWRSGSSCRTCECP